MTKLVDVLDLDSNDYVVGVRVSLSVSLLFLYSY